jgi:hypothetical protein
MLYNTDVAARFSTPKTRLAVNMLQTLFSNIVDIVF